MISWVTMQRNYYCVRSDSGTEVFATSRTHAILVSPQDLANAWRSAGVDIPAEYAVAAAELETSFATNEIDVEPDGFTSRGIFQISNGHKFDDGYDRGDDEVRDSGVAMPEHVDLLDLDDAIEVFAALQGKRLEALVAAWRVQGFQAEAVPIPRDMYAYLGIAHNEGVSAAIKSIRSHGLDWKAYKTRNGACSLHRTFEDKWDRGCEGLGDTCSAYIRRAGRYGDYSMTGGTRWNEVVSL